MKQIHTTKDYNKFTSVGGNRVKNEAHLKKLKKSMAERYLFTVIVVNENYEIIDGQHRFDCAKELGLEINYVICEGYGLDEVQRLNQVNKTWSIDDYMTGYCDSGKQDYIVYKQFKERYNINHLECIKMLAGSISAKEEFKAGRYKITNLKYAQELMEKIQEIKKYYKGAGRRKFIRAFSKLIENRKFVYSEFLKKIKLKPELMCDCVGVKEYIENIEEVYNYKRHKKVNLRF